MPRYATSFPIAWRLRGLNATLREKRSPRVGGTDLARLGRKSLSFSKSVELHDKVIGHYLNIKHYQ
ncbi:IS1 family transposase [Escherichia coli]|uniref:IS1 family transposase n=1 Tax=Escherichia coli TaxID=562 RepID=UPI0039B4FD80